MSPPWLSVLIPVYNVVEYLHPCVASVMNQADEGVEILLLDDASTDGSGELLRTLAAHCPRLKYVAHERNRGLSAARNSLLDLATGTYIWFLDSDDYMMPGAIDSLRRIVEQHAPDLVMCDFRQLRSGRQMRTFRGPERQLLSDPSLLLEGIFETLLMCTWGRVAKRLLWSAPLRFPVGQYFEDVSTTPFLSLRARSYWYEPEAWVGYRVRSGSITNTFTQPKAEQMFQIVMKEVLPGLQDTREKLPLNDRALFAWVYFATCHFCSTFWMARQIGVDSKLLTSYRQTFKKSLPCSIGSLRAHYLRNGKLYLLLRLYYWMLRARIWLG